MTIGKEKGCSGMISKTAFLTGLHLGCKPYLKSGDRTLRRAFTGNRKIQRMKLTLYPYIPVLSLYGYGLDFS